MNHLAEFDDEDGLVVGNLLGFFVGVWEGEGVGPTERVGVIVGDLVESFDIEGEWLGLEDGCSNIEGGSESSDVGLSVGDMVLEGFVGDPVGSCEIKGLIDGWANIEGCKELLFVGIEDGDTVG
mmetsp:Transcript_35055/g.59528  ORF Transcript_35055/g.59528 Transcript_35055/m.59528 type:complete len:124 (-) Transcript_35055:697-1068(-)|eukprot:CAMPEP_0183783844 /NCGR_PEP_ID=MMETSP0739-20130205/64530_1 /TAXON_ID=385413 /ORGANISM="Thalassiosira miniscula, Strain CCMP1093" /LENGTH=123 /DNA_ID=CAMNT_0026027629 /DNA_START=225 /DNA_END=596 /DNA_ORIENTATION=-